jgi:hypothetical protein
MSVTTLIDILVDRNDISESRASTREIPELAEGEILLKLERFGFSANNVTYATLGDAMGYWRFFPAVDGWGSVPVWGHASVEASKSEAIEVGSRYFGYYPLSTHLVAQPTKVTPGGFVDGVAHRVDLPLVYQRYTRVEDAETADVGAEDQQALWRPLFVTSYGAADFLKESNAFDATTIALTSASSKTAMGIAFCLKHLGVDAEIVGLTSPTNLEFTTQTGYYDQVLTYDQLNEIGSEALVLVDLAGNESILTGIAEATGDALLRTIIVGGTHWEDRERSLTESPPGTELFFLPTWIEKRRADWGPTKFLENSDEAWEEFTPTTDSWLRISEHHGTEEIEAVYANVLSGKSRPDIGFILAFD